MRTQKSVIILILAAFGFSINLKGQPLDRLPEFGIKGGLNLTNLTIEGRTENSPGFHAGLFMRFPFGINFSVQPEVLYSSKGTEIKHDEEFAGIPIIEGITYINMQYIDVPVMMVYTLAEGLNFKIGPYAGFILDADFATHAEILDFLEIEAEEDIDTEHFKNIDAGLAAGIELDIGNLTLGLRYYLGLTRVAEEEMALDPILGDAGNRVLQVHVGFRF